MKNKWMIISLLITMILGGCARAELYAPCKNFGAYCKKTPINSWDYFDNTGDK